MKAVRIEHFGPVEETLLFADTPTPTPTENHVLVKIGAAAINPSDVKNVEGLMQATTTLPRTLGRDFAGVVVSGAPELVGKAVWGTGGDVGFTRDGSHAEYLLLPAYAVSPRPDNLSVPEAAAVGVGFCTAWAALMEKARLAPGESVLVVGGTGSVGTAAAQIARSKEAGHVYATVRFSYESSGLAPALPGVDTIINLAQGLPLNEQIHNATSGRGVDVIINTVGGHTFEPSLNALADNGRMVVIAASGDPRPEFSLLDFYRRNLQLLGLNTLFQTTEDCARILDQLAPGFVSGDLLPPRVRTYPFAQASGAYELVMMGSSGEKVVLVMDEAA